jgi:putative Holliday junction resolvase
MKAGLWKVANSGRPLENQDEIRDPMNRIIGIDYGERRVGLAVSDPLGITAQGLDTFDRRSGDFLEHLSGLVSYYDIARMVIGHPVSMSGRPSQTSRRVEQLADQLRERFDLDVILWDERLSSAEARRTVAGSRAGKKAVDRVAAVLILQGYLDSRASGEETP